MKIILVRHGTRASKQSDSPLSPGGERSVDELAKLLGGKEVLDRAILLTSPARYAIDTGHVLARNWGVVGKDPISGGRVPRKIEPVCALSHDYAGSNIFKDLVAQANLNGIDIDGLDLVTVVGHHPKLGETLIKELTSKENRRVLQRAEAVVLSADSLKAFESGGGDIEYWTGDIKPGICSTQLEEKLRQKIETKMTVATFLAGFTFAALLELIKDPNHFDQSRIAVTVSAISLTFALALFICAVYMYDRLTMPRAFQGAKTPGRVGRKLEEQVKKLALHGEKQPDTRVYDYMIWTWKYIFTPAVILAMVGFAVMLSALANSFVFYLPLATIVATILIYFVFRPMLGTTD